MTDLSTRYLGLTLRSPLVVSANPLCKTLANLRAMEDAGAAAIVLHSLFEEQLNLESNELDRFLWDATDVSAEATSIFPDLSNYNLGPDAYLEHIRRAKQALTIPLIASLNGVSRGGWIKFARQIEQAGADALELNIYFLAADPAYTSGDIERFYVDLVRELRATVHLPLAVKIAPYFSSLPHVAERLEAAGANALVLFNRFYQPDLDLEALEVRPTLALSTSRELRLRLHWAAVLHSQLHCDLSITGGVHTAEDVVKSMMVGGKVVEVASCLLANGIGYLRQLHDGLDVWCQQHEYESLQPMQGAMDYGSVPNPKAFHRSNYMRVLSSYTVR